MLITYLASARAVIELCRSLGVQIVQLHGEMAAGALRRLRALDPGLTVVKSLVVGLHPMAVLEQMVGALSPYVDGLSPTRSRPKPAQREPPAGPTTGR